MTYREQLDRAARAHGLDVDPDTLLAIVHAAFAPRETMTEGERAFLIDSGAPPDSFDPARQAEARARLVARAAATMRDASPVLSVQDVATTLGVGPSTVRRRAAAGDLYAVASGPRHALGFPAWQFTTHGQLPGLRDVLAALPASAHPLSVEGFMLTPQEELDGRTPIGWLAGGEEVIAVVQLADSYARR